MEFSDFTTATRVTREKASAAFATFYPGEDEDDLAGAKAPRTMVQYASRWRCYLKWCEAEGREPMPASPAQLLAFVRHLRKLARAPSTIECYVAALATIHRYHGYAIDRTIIVEPLKSARRNAGPRRRARPLLGPTLEAIVKRLEPGVPRDVRDAVMMMLGFAAALRSVELVGLDWERQGPEMLGGTGFLGLDPRGLTIDLGTSKASQLTSVQIGIPTKDMPSLRTWLDRWIEMARIGPGEPIFRAIAGRRILPRRIAEETVLQVVRRRMLAHTIATGKSAGEASLLARSFSSHSLRRGYCSTASERRTPLGEIRKRSRHSSDAMLGIYIADAEGWRASGLKGVGF